MENQPIRVDLKGDLAGFHILLDPEELTFGFLEDIESMKVGAMLTALAGAIVGGDLPKGTDRAGLRRLKQNEAKALIEGVGSTFAVPKS
jgi:hypothetical protein